jgi:hypothetical protein
MPPLHERYYARADLMQISAHMGSSAKHPDPCAGMLFEGRLGTPAWRVCHGSEGGCIPVAFSGWHVV